MKIGIDIRSLMDEEYSGVSEYTKNLLEALLKIDKENTYKLFYNKFRKSKKLLEKYESENVQIIKTSYPNKIFNFVFQKILKYPKIDQLLQVDLFFMPNIGFVSLKGSAKSVVTVHDLSFERYKDFFSLRRRLWHKAVKTKKFLFDFDKIVAVSEHTKNDLIKLYEIDEKKIRVIYSAIGDDFFENKNERDVRKKYNLPDKYIFSLATIEPRKNLESIIEAYESFVINNPKFDDVSLVIAGARGWKKGRIERTLKKSLLKKKIKFIGYVDKKDKKMLYTLAELFIYVSFYEGFGFPPLEAMASRCPVLTAGNSSLAEISGEAVFLVNSFKVSEIEQGIKIILSDKSYRNDLILRGETWSKKFNWQESAKEYLKLFKELKK